VRSVGGVPGVGIGVVALGYVDACACKSVCVVLGCVNVVFWWCRSVWRIFRLIGPVFASCLGTGIVWPINLRFGNVLFDLAPPLVTGIV